MRYTAPFLSVITLGLAIVSSSTLALADSNAVRELATQNNGFGIDLYRELTSDSTENTLISPYSIFSALGMTYTGAQGVTASEMTKSLHFTQSFLETQRAFKSLNDELNVDKTEADYELIVANRLWGQQGMKWKSSFLNLTASIFGAGLQVEDFANTPEAACLNINNWVANKTNDRIKNIVPPNALTPLTKLVITNAIYFNGVWRYKFVNDFTAKDIDFTTVDGTTTKVSMMRQHEHFQYREDQILNSQVVRMQYASKDPKHSLSMVVWVPQERTGYHQLEQSLTPDVLTQSLAAIYSAPSYKVNLSLPRWKVEFSKSLKPALINNGMQTLFDDTRANLRGMYEPTSPSENLYVTDVLHKTFIEVQEGGTEAAGATAVIIATRSSSNPSNIKTVVADHAFLYAIVDDATQAVLFLGRLVNPSPY